jgi:CheY-like chemotaxis protein
MRRVLIIEDESTLRSNVARGIGKLGVLVDEAGTLNDALELIDRHPPDLVLSDIDMPDRSGLELLGELGRRGLKPPVVFVSGYLNAYRAQIPPHASIEVIEKPVSIEELRNVVSRRLGASVASEEPSPFSVPDYVQLACLGRHSVIVEVELAAQHLGEVVVADGQLWSARDGDGAGLEALGRLAFGGRGTARCRRFTGSLPPRNLEGSWEYLLIEAARVTDEGGRDADSGDLHFELDPGPHRHSQLVAESGTLRKAEPAKDADTLAFETAFDSGIDALLAKRHQEAVDAFRRALELRPDDAKARANLARLAELGFRAASGGN